MTANDNGKATMGADTMVDVIGDTKLVPSAPEPPHIARLRTRPAKVAIVGYTYSQRQAPWDDVEWQKWGINNLHIYIKDAQWSRWFDLHDLATIEADDDHVAWLKAQTDLPVFCWDPQADWPTALPYPKDEITSRFGRYFTNSISWMIAMAIAEVEWAIPSGEAEIGVYGVDMAQGSEYAAQRPSCEYYLGLAQGMGIKVTLAETSDLLKSLSLYGAEDGTPFRKKLDEREVELTARMGELQSQRNQLIDQISLLEAGIHQHEGALETIRYLTGVWTMPESDKEHRAANDVRSGGT